jgi:hypothetical protein
MPEASKQSKDTTRRISTVDIQRRLLALEIWMKKAIEVVGLFLWILLACTSPQ